MLRPNIVLDAPPTTIKVGGLSYQVQTDFIVWIDILNDLSNLYTKLESDDDIEHNAFLITLVSVKLLGKPLKFETPEIVTEFLTAVTEFSKGYPQAPVNGSEAQTVQTYSFDYDLSAIAIAFMKYYNIDITYTRDKELHWWLFLEYFRNLCGDDLMILRMMEIRGYQGKDKELRKQASRYALPVKHTAQESKLMDDINDEFYGAH